MSKLTLYLFIALLVSACSSDPITDRIDIYQLDIQQGNLIKQDMVNQLKPGLSKRQVVFIMGSPLLTDTFHQNRWDYIFTLKPIKGEVKKARMSLFFDSEGLLTETKGDFTPDKNAKITSKKMTYDVPPPKEDYGILDKLFRKMGFNDE